MNLKELSQLRAQGDVLSQRRHAEASENYEVGLRAFVRAANSDFRDKAALHEAFDIWLEAIRTHRQNPKPYIGIGYIFMLLGDTRNAVTYFKSALSIEPNNPDAQLYLENLQSLAAPKQPISTSPSVPRSGIHQPHTDEEYDALYEQTESLIYSHIRVSMGLPPPEPTADKHRQAQLEQILSEQNDNMLEIQSRLEILDQEIDISPLQQQLRPFEALLRRYRRALEITAVFQEMTHQLQQGLDMVSELEKAFKLEGRIPKQQVLETLLDQCDACADQLEDYERQNISIMAVSELYERFVSAVSSLQEALDELAISEP